MKTHKKEEIISKKAYPAVGPYSQAIRAGNQIFCSGIIGVVPKTNNMIEGGTKEQIRQIFKNLQEVLKAAGANLDDVVKTTVYLQNMDDFPVMNGIYATYFKKPYPVRATIEVAKLPRGALIEIECIAYLNNKSCGCCEHEK